MLTKQTAYEKWLGIKSHDQPPTLYRLLGVDAFESDPDAISYAADGRMSLLRQFQISENGQLAEQILGELSQARVMLLNAEKKAAYDARLRKRIATQTAAVASPNLPTVAKVSPLPRAESLPTPMRPSQASAASPVLDLDTLTSEVRSTNPISLGRPKKKSNLFVWVAAAASVALVIVAIVVINSPSAGDDSSTKDALKTVAAHSATPEAAHPVAPKSSVSPQSLDKSPKVVPDHAVAPPVEPPTPTPILPPVIAVAPAEPPSADSKEPIPAPIAETLKAPAAVVPSLTEPALIPVPSASAQADAIKLVKEIYGKEWAAAKSADQKQALGKKLLEKAMESGNDRLAQFVLFRLSKEIAEQASDCQTAFESIEETGKVFQINGLEMKVEALRKCASAATTVEQHASVAEKAAQISGQAVATDDFAQAKPMIDLAVAEAKKAKDESLVKKSTERKAEIERTAQASVAAKTAAAILEKTPLDPDANLTVGKYQCFFKGDWEGGLPKLALGSDTALKMLAKTELKGVVSSGEQAKLGDAWWNVAENRKGAEKKLARARAGYWYKQSLPSLTGLQKDKVEKRIEEVGEPDQVTLLSPNTKDRWVLLFRASDPAVWDTDSREKDRFAIPLAKAPEKLRFLKMQLNPKEFIVIAMSKDKLGVWEHRDTIGWTGRNNIAWGGHQLGVFDRNTPPAGDSGVCISYEAPPTGSLSGWGFGYKYPGNVQGWAWGRTLIEPTVFEISVTSSDLTPAEQKRLLK